MKKIQKLSLACMLSLTILFSSCYGPFNLTHQLHDWNGSLGDDEVVEVVFLALCIIPVYEFCVFLDGVVFNTLEYWTGNNPIAMKDGEKEMQVIKFKGKKYEVTAEQNKFHIVPLESVNDSTNLFYVEAEKTWYIEQGHNVKKLLTY